MDLDEEGDAEVWEFCCWRRLNWGKPGFSVQQPVCETCNWSAPCKRSMSLLERAHNFPGEIEPRAVKQNKYVPSSRLDEDRHLEK